MTKLRDFLGFAYNLKAIADYHVGPGSEVPPELAAEAAVMGSDRVSRSLRDQRLRGVKTRQGDWDRQALCR